MPDQFDLPFQQVILLLHEVDLDLHGADLSAESDGFLYPVVPLALQFLDPANEVITVEHLLCLLLLLDLTALL